MAPQSIARRRPEALLLLLLTGCVVALSLQVRRPDGRVSAEGWILDAAGIWVRLWSSARESARDLAEWTSGRESLRVENRLLRAQVSRLEGELLRLRSAEKDRDRLVALMGSWPSPPAGTHPARLVALTTSGPFHSALLDRGTDDGVAVGGVVTGVSGLLGRVVATGRKTSRVQLLTDRLSAAGVVLPRTGRGAVARGDGSGNVSLQYVPALADVVAGEAVVTSGTDGIYPKDMPVGSVREVRPGGPSLFLDVPLRLTADARTESLVFVLPPLVPAGAAAPPGPARR